MTRVREIYEAVDDRVDSVLVPGGMLALGGILAYRGIELDSTADLAASGLASLGSLATAVLFRLRRRR